MTAGVTKPGAFAQLSRTPGVPAAFVLVLLAFGGFSLLLPVVPLAVVRGGGSELVAGATTGVFMTVTVLVQLLTPRITAAIGYRWVLAIGSALLGLPSGLLALFDGPFAVLAVSGVRGAGFGMMTVAGSALVAELAPPGMLGRATSLIGLAVGISEAIFLPVGLWLLEVFGLATVAWSATAFGVVGLLAAARLPDVHPAPARPSDPSALGRRAMLVLLAGPFLVMVAVSLPYGAAASFLSPALDSIVSGSGAVVAGVGLGLLGVGVIVGRTFAGLVSDRRGPGALVWPGLAVSALGMAGIAGLLSVSANPWWFIAPTVVFGLGFGAVQNEALVASFERMPRSRLGTASASWNISFDAGTGLGSVVMGGVAGFGYVVLFTVAAGVVLLVGGPAAVGARRTRPTRDLTSPATDDKVSP
ncbi:MAG: MFS transporter [Dietzia sp.]|uniref:MFS transporter n=6 Tax=Dietzia TaxID=37914 RepID=A0ABN2IP40_9ACTN|nr:MULTISPECIES: MFS transporter [Dietzia]MBB1037217.1 MFS transporter [Dietzia natronolimnaea]MBB1041117.1 MFS transporter [Dietzia sp. Cai40]MBC7295364.1 MFS transporter [Dietzia sp.]MCT1516408.1 MFS transporter [Dietzia cercidiphylli]MDO8394801.1 MFS transporter [Dietzia sp.]